MAVVLVVDDSEVDRGMLVRVLGEAGHTTLEARDLSTALRTVHARSPDLVLTDMVSGMDSYEFVRRLRSDAGIEQPRVVLCTAIYLAAPALELAEACGVSRVMTKPVDPDEIVDAVTSILDTDIELPPAPPDGFDRAHLRLISQKLLEKVQELQAANHDRSRLVSDLVRAQESERTRIAAAVHDDSIQMMAAVCLHLDLLRDDLADPVQQEAVHAVAEKAGRAVGRLRRLIFDLSPRGAENGGLATGIEAYLREVGSEAGFAWEMHGDAPPTLSDEVETILYRVAQEATRNAHKHADPTNVRIELGLHDGGTLMTIADDGVGFRPEAADENRPGHVGLVSMRERVALVGGTFRLESAPDEGCTVSVWIPDA